MGARGLRETSGRTKKGREAVDAAIRTELPGRNEALDAIARLESWHAAARGNGDPTAAEPSVALDDVRSATEAMAAEIARRFGFKSATGE